MKKVPCRGCSERSIEPNCHSICEKYIGWKQEHDQLQEKIRTKKEAEFEAKEVGYAGRKRMIRGQR